MNDRRSFFKGLAAFASGVVAAKVASYTPKKEEPKEEKKEEVMVSSYITIKHNGEEYHPLVVKKTDADKTTLKQTGKSPFDIIQWEHSVRKVNV